MNALSRCGVPHPSRRIAQASNYPDRRYEGQWNLRSCLRDLYAKIVKASKAVRLLTEPGDHIDSIAYLRIKHRNMLPF